MDDLKEEGKVAEGRKYLTIQLFHGDQIQGLQGMAGGGNEVEARMDPSVMVVEE